MEKNRSLAVAPILLLVIVYSIVAFTNLGNFNSPQTTWGSEEGNHVFISFEEDIYISRFQFMTGARDDVGFTLFGSLDGYYWPVSVHVENLSVFRWHEFPFNAYVRYMQIVPFGPGLYLQEFAFRDRWDRLTPNNQILGEVGSAYALFDEQHLVPDRSSFMNSTYFDEIYHARTGYEFVHELWVLETTHPPMGKNFIAASVQMLGMTPFAWRLPGTIAGILMVVLMYLFGHVVFRSSFWGFMAAFIFAFDFMTFAQTRIATIDSYVTLFIIASYLFMFIYVRDSDEMELKESIVCLICSGFFIGLAIASKWQGIYAAMGLPVLFFPSLYRVYKYDKREARITFFACFPIFILIPGIIYTLSYIPFVRAMDQGDGFWRTMIDNQIFMFSYHAWLDAYHSFSSQWWEWPLLIRPIFYYVSHLPDDMRQGISSFGNPAVWWTGIGATFMVITALIKREFAKDEENFRIVYFLLIAYAAQYLPWVFIDRPTFIYHYFPSVPFVVLLIVFCLKNYVHPRFPKMVWAYAGLVLGLFVLFYPVLSGMTISTSFGETFLRWFPPWVLF